MEPTSLINEAHLLERKSEDAARRGRFDDAIDFCVAAADCLVRLLNDDRGGVADNAQPTLLPRRRQSPPPSRHRTQRRPLTVRSDVHSVGGQVEASILAQLTQLDTRQKLLIRKKRQFDFLKDILTSQREESLRRRQSQRKAVEEGEPQQRCRRGSTVKRRLSCKEGENRRRNGCPETAANQPSTGRTENRGIRNEVVDGAKPDSFYLLHTVLDDAGREQGSGRFAAEAVVLGEALEKMRFSDDRSDRRVALEASLYEMSMNPPRSGVGGVGRKNGGDDTGGVAEEGRKSGVEAAGIGKRSSGEERWGRGAGGDSNGQGERTGEGEKTGRGDEGSGESIHRLRLDKCRDDDFLFAGFRNPKHFLRLKLPPLESPPVTIPSLSPIQIPNLDPLKIE